MMISDLKILIPQMVIGIILIQIFGTFLLPIEIALRNPIVFSAVLVSIVNHYYKRYQRLNYRLTKGWIVRGNVIE